MRRDDINEIGLAILLVAVVLLAADCVWLHVKCVRQEAALAAQADKVVELSKRVELHINPSAPPSEPTFADKAIQTYEKVKSAAARGIEAAKEAYSK